MLNGVTPQAQDVPRVDEIDRLRRLVFDQTAADEHANGGGDWLEPSLDPRTLALVRLGALVAVGGSRVPSYGSLTDAALDAGASVTDVVDVLLGVLPVVGAARVVAAAPGLALALGHDMEDTADGVPSQW